MKSSAAKLLFYIEIFFLISLPIGVIISFIFILDSIFPAFFHSLLFLKVIAWSILIISIICMIAIIRKLKKKPLYLLPKPRKILHCTYYLIIAIIFLFSIEYLLFLNYKNNFNIENEYLKNSLQIKIDNINHDIEYCERYLKKYTSIYSNIESSQYIPCIFNNDNSFYTTIYHDTIKIVLFKSPFSNSGTIIKENHNKQMLFTNVKEVSILLKGESYDITHPSNIAILESLKRQENIKKNDFQILVLEKIKFYKNQFERLKTIKKNELFISFWDFIIYCIFNNSVTDNKTHFFIRLIFLLQTIIITFFSGYIFQTLYKIMDGEK